MNFSSKLLQWFFFWGQIFFYQLSDLLLRLLPIKIIEEIIIDKKTFNIIDHFCSKKKKRQIVKKNIFFIFQIINRSIYHKKIYIDLEPDNNINKNQNKQTTMKSSSSSFGVQTQIIDIDDICRRNCFLDISSITTTTVKKPV